MGPKPLKEREKQKEASELISVPQQLKYKKLHMHLYNRNLKYANPVSKVTKISTSFGSTF